MPRFIMSLEEAVCELFRGLNYDKFFKEGDTKRATIDEFNSDNTRRLNLEETKEKIARQSA